MSTPSAEGPAPPDPIRASDTHGQHGIATEPVTGPDRTRLAFLDAIRGLAASIVVLAHIGPLVSDSFAWTYLHVVDFGQLGVVLFFICSGFVIPSSLERENSLAAFWVKRFFRLYPVFWVSLLGAFAYAGLRIKENGDLMAADWLANITMAAPAFGAQVALPPYWTLVYELLFYGLVSVLFLLRISHLSVELSLLTSAAGISLALLVPLPVADQLNGGVFWIGSMFTGTVLHRWFHGQTRALTAAACVLGTLAVGVLSVVTSLHGVARDSDPFHSHMWPLITAWVGAYLIFFGLLATRRYPIRLLVWLGTISYSMYVLHELVLVVVPKDGPPLVPIALGFALTVALSALTYRWIEAPGMAAGRKYAARV